MHRVRYLPVVLTTLVTFAGSAQAQQAGEVLREAEDDLMVQPFNVKAEDLEDADLVNQAGEEIGEVEEVLVNANGEPAAVTAEVGGFLGMGQKAVVISLDQLQMKDDDLVTTLTKEELGALQAWGQ